MSTDADRTPEGWDGKVPAADRGAEAYALRDPQSGMIWGALCFPYMGNGRLAADPIWQVGHSVRATGSEMARDGWSYVGRLYTPAEVAAREQRAKVMRAALVAIQHELSRCRGEQSHRDAVRFALRHCNAALRCAQDAPGRE